MPPLILWELIGMLLGTTAYSIPAPCASAEKVDREFTKSILWVSSMSSSEPTKASLWLMLLLDQREQSFIAHVQRGDITVLLDVSPGCRPICGMEWNGMKYLER